MSESGALPRGFKLATVWLLLGTALFIGVQWWLSQAQRARFSFDGTAIELRRGNDGHFHWPGRVNGVAVDFLVDTGATRTALPLALAQRAGVGLSGRVRSETAGGTVQGQIGSADIALDGDLNAQRHPVVVLPELQTALLGMDVLGRLRLTQNAGVLRIEKPEVP